MTMFAPASPEHPAGTDDPITTIVIAGATGDLAQRKLLPALYHLWIKGRLAPNVSIVGFARAVMTADEFREFMWRGIQEIGGLEPRREDWDAFSPRLNYFGGDLAKPDDVDVLRVHIEELEGGDAKANRLFYLSITPAIFDAAVSSLGACGLVEETPESGWKRVVIEKPFGRDLESAHALNSSIHRVFREDQVYRIDHYLGKETVQNLLVLRFANAIFEPIWNRNYVDNVQITVAESVDVGERAGYYDQFGVVRDMIQNHLLQVLTLVAMEPPVTLEADSLRNKKVEALRAIRPWTAIEAARNAVRAQYIGYRDAQGVDPHSATPTYAAMRLYLDNWRWQGVPFYLRSGKAMARKSSEIAIQFRAPPHRIFPANPMWGPLSNILTLRLQPDEGVHLRFAAKLPDEGMAVRPVHMDFHYGTEFGTDDLPEAYERLLQDALEGDASLFIRSDHIEEAWKIVDPLLEAWEDSISHPVQWYEPGSWGPETADALLSQDGRSWATVGDRHGRISD